jgi:hypothetical protein
MRAADATLPRHWPTKQDNCPAVRHSRTIYSLQCCQWLSTGKKSGNPGSLSITRSGSCAHQKQISSGSPLRFFFLFSSSSSLKQPPTTIASTISTRTKSTTTTTTNTSNIANMVSNPTDVVSEALCSRARSAGSPLWSVSLQVQPAQAPPPCCTQGLQQTCPRDPVLVA